MKNKRFEEVHKEGKFTVSKVIRDNETGVLYLVHQEGYGMGLTVLVDAEGKPIVDKDY